jgi:SAM-dependent methyltransferase
MDQHAPPVQMDHRRIFNDIYLKNTWTFGSGTASLEEATREYRGFLQNFMRSNRIKSVLDVGCGDWQFSQLINWDGIAYTGIDVSDVALANSQRFSRQGVQFIELNALTEPLPKADLLIVKDVLQHWSNAEISHFLPRLRKFEKALVVTGGGRGGNLLRPDFINADISTGFFRPVDLTQKPFSVKGTFIFWYLGYNQEPMFVFLWTR